VLDAGLFRNPHVNLVDPPLARMPPQRPGGARDGVRELGESSSLPRLDPRAGKAFNRLHDRRAAPLALAWRGGSLAVQWTFGDAPPQCDGYRFRLGTHAGYVALDLPAQAALLGEPRPERIPRELRAILLAEAAQAWVDAVERATRQRLEWMPGEALEPFDAQRAACFRLVDGAAGTAWRGFVQFEDPAALEAFAPVPDAPGASADALAGLRFPLHFRLGETRIRLREVRGIEAGDILSIEHWRAAGPAVVVDAELGGGLRLAGLADGTRITLQNPRDDLMNRNPDPAAGAEPHDAAELPIDRLDALEVTLRFEVGDLQLSLGDLRNLRPGHVFELGQPLNRSPVRILAHGNLLGKGTLVAVGDRLGVRVSEFAPGEI
jgi:type III secretion protein Q